MPDFNKFFSQKKNVGITLGFLIGFSIVIFGFWKALVLIIATSMGYIIGKFSDEKYLETEEDTETTSIIKTPEKKEEPKGEQIMKEKLMEIFPEIKQIKNDDLREKTINVWLESLKIGGWTLDDLKIIPFTLLIPNTKVTLVDHTRAVTEIAIASVNTFEKYYGNLIPINRDYLISGALLHDVGKLLEYERSEKGEVVKCRFGDLLRHPFSGTSLAFKFNLPAEVCHIIAVHAKEGDGQRVTPEAIVVNHADFINFHSLKL